MKKILALIFGGLIVVVMLSAGQVETETNQSDLPLVEPIQERKFNMIMAVQEAEKPEKIEIPDDEYPTTSDQRKEYVLRYLQILGETDIATWDRVIVAETREDPYSRDLESRTAVQHCRGDNGWYANVEYCFGNDYAGKREYAKGIFQILPSTWTNRGCDGSYDQWKKQVECAIKIKNMEGMYAWSTY